MSEKPQQYRVKSGKVIFHGGERFEEGAEIELVPDVAEVHAPNLELIEPEEPPTAKRTRTKTEKDVEDATN